jgi:hypothetical protein
MKGKQKGLVRIIRRKKLNQKQRDYFQAFGFSEITEPFSHASLCD